MGEANINFYLCDKDPIILPHLRQKISASNSAMLLKVTVNYTEIYIDIRISPLNVLVILLRQC